MFLVNVEKCLRIFSKVYVSSDSQEILQTAQAAGAIPIRRGIELCGDTPNIPVYRHAFMNMGDIDGIIAVQANSPTINPRIILQVKRLMQSDAEEVMTCHPDYSIYGSVWAMSRNRLLNYDYNPKPDALIVDISTDIHTEEDLAKAKNGY